MCTGFCERGEGGKGGGELGSDKKVEPTGWKVIFLAESHVGCREQGAPRFPPASLNACVVLVLVTSKALVILGHTSLQKPTCAWWSRLTFAHIYILQTHAQSGSLHMTYTPGMSKSSVSAASLALRGLSEQMKRTGSLLLSLTQRDSTTEENDRAVNKKSRGRRECGESQVCQSAKSWVFIPGE